MPDHLPNEGASIKLNALAQEIYETLADQFPVCLSSDEFHFFPQFKMTRRGVSKWDDFSEDALTSFFSRAAQWQTRLHKFTSHQPFSEDLYRDIQLLSRMVNTLEEQLRLVQPHRTQPTFYLTIVSIGLAEAMDQSRDAFGRRIDALPEFLNRAMTNLMGVPVVFADLAVEMISKLSDWLLRLPLTDKARRSTMEALNQFQNHLPEVQTAMEFRLKDDLYARVADFHIGCRMDLDEIARHLDDEIGASTRRLVQSAHRLSAGAPWQDVFHALPSPEATDGEAVGLYQEVITRLKGHCLKKGFFREEDVAGCDVEIQTIPEHMIPVRADAAYTMPPGHPPTGGVFYILPAARQTLPRDMKLLAAHETLPGHHLLDTLRWRHRRPLRRCLEFPLFYEGWASFGEEILFDTAFFSGPADRLLMAKRRFWRAHRGRAELRIHTGQRSLKEAAMELADVGLVTREQALAMVRRYALKPGYQLSYAIGRRNFRRIYNAYLGQGHTLSQFVTEVLSEGEIGFDHLEQHMLNKQQKLN